MMQEIDKSLITIRKSKRAKRIRLSVRSSTDITLTVPYVMTARSIHHFMNSHREWIQKSVRSFSRFQQKKIVAPWNGTQKEYLQYKEQAYKKISSLVEEYTKIYSLSYHRVFIKNQKHIWGSCSSKKNLNFNYRLFFLSDDLIRYVVVHELCHLQYMNHSKQFWNAVAKTIPNYAVLRKQLKKFVL